MGKKMTQKEFKEIFEKAGFTFDLWGWEGILNMISGYNQILAEECFKNGANSAGQRQKKQSDIIFAELEARGYYNN